MKENNSPETENQAPETCPAPDTAEEKGTAGEAEKAGPDGAKSEEKEPASFPFTREQVEKMEEAARQLDALKEHFIRQAAEYENYRKRTTREKETLYQDAKADTIKAFLPVYDDLERASAQADGEDSPHKKGLDLIFQKFRDTLKNLGVTEIEALGQPFDPERHNAVQHVEDETQGENTVSQVFQAGFLLNGKVIRHAMVAVAN